MGNPLLDDDGPLINWDTIGQIRFDRLIADLVGFQHPEDSTVQTPEGRGGDGGIDTLVVEPNGRKIIYQFKYFPEGFDGKHKARRRQIANPVKSRKNWGSLEHALEHEPDEWVLVVPCLPTQSGWAWIETLKTDYSDRVKITFIDRRQLDGPKWCAGHQDVVTSLHTRPELLTKAAILGQERAVLAHPDDLHQRLRALGGVVDDVDPAWTLDFQRVGDTIVQTLRAKHPLAAQTNPINVNFTAKVLPDDKHLAAFQRAIDYGSFTPAVLPGRLVENFQVAGSPLVEQDDVDRVLHVIEVHPSVHTPEGERVALVLRTEDDAVIANSTGQVRRVSPGNKGVTLEQVLHGALMLTWRLPTDLAEPGTVGVAFDSGKAQDAGELLKAMRLVQKLSRARTIELQLRGKALMRGRFAELTQLKIAQQVDDDQALLETVEDLAILQQATDTFFPVPASIEPIDRIWLRVIRMALEGRMCFEPEQRTRLNMTFKPEAAQDEGVTRFLAGESLLFRVTNQKPSKQRGDHEMVLPGVHAFVMRSGALRDADAVRAGLERGEDTAAVITSDSDKHLVVYMPSRIAANTPVDPQPWGLTGINEVAKLRAEIE